jgi:diguanylate cyclase (GGDEF)-like protein
LLLKKQLKEKEAKIEYLAHHDTLTDTPNRLLFNATLTREIEQAKRYKRLFAVLYLDLDRFKNINDSLGHTAGDSLLQQVSQRFKSVMRGEDMLARLGGDEFAVLISNINKIEDAILCAQKLIDILKNSFIVDGEKIHITSSIGIATYPASGETIEELMRNADIAMYQAKYDGKNIFKLYTSETIHQLNQRVHIESALRDAIKNNELYLCYQPIYCLSDTSLLGLEVLLRWNHDTFSNIPVDQIISVAEESGLILTIGDWIINEAFHEYHSWKLKDNASVKLALNISYRQLNSTAWFSRVKQFIENHQMDPCSLIFELTESDIIRDMRIAKETLSLFVKIGSQIFIDDFGMGYSSLKMIQNFPISGLKIDKSCTEDLEDNSSSRNLVKSLFMLAENMGYIVVAEGIETKIQLDLLKSYVDGKGQGYYLSKPLPSAGIVELLHQCGKT